MGRGMGVNGGETANSEWDRLLSEQIRQNGRFFFRLAHNVLRDAQLAEDVCQQALLRAWEERERIQSGPTLKSWLARTVVNNSLQLVRRGKVERRVLGHQAYVRPDEEGPPGTREEDREAVLAALNRLPEPTRLVVALRVLEGMAGNDVKELLGCSAAEVSRQLHRGLEQLRGMLTDAPPGNPTGQAASPAASQAGSHGLRPSATTSARPGAD